MTFFKERNTYSLLAQAKSDKKGCALRITQKPGADGIQANHIFVFNSGNCAQLREDFINSFSAIIKRNKQNESEKGVQGVEEKLTDVDIENRLYLLVKKKELSALHRELVQSGLIPETSFWESKKHLLLNREWIKKQQKAEVPKFTFSNKKLSEEDNFTFRITPEYINMVFEIYPPVKMAHDDLVKNNKMTDEAFWNYYFESKYRNRSATSPKKNNIFEKYEEKYVEDLSAQQLDPNYNTKGVPLMFDLLATKKDIDEELTPAENKNNSSRTGMLIRKLNRDSCKLLEGISKRKKQHMYKNVEKLYNDSITMPDLVVNPSKKFVEFEPSQNEYSVDPDAFNLSQKYAQAIKNTKYTSPYTITGWNVQLNKLRIDPEITKNTLGTIMRDCMKIKKNNIAEKDQNASMTYLSTIELLRRLWSVMLNTKSSQNLAANLSSVENVVQALKGKLDTIKKNPALHDFSQEIFASLREAVVFALRRNQELKKSLEHSFDAPNGTRSSINSSQLSGF